MWEKWAVTTPPLWLSRDKRRMIQKLDFVSHSKGKVQTSHPLKTPLSPTQHYIFLGFSLSQDFFAQMSVIFYGNCFEFQASVSLWILSWINLGTD